MSYVCEEDYIRHTVTGMFQLGQLVDTAWRIAALHKKHNCNRFLCDVSQAVIDFSFVELYNRPRFFNETGIPPGVKRALVLFTEFPHKKFLWNVIKNAGHNMEIFYNFEGATEWLLA